MKRLFPFVFVLIIIAFMSVTSLTASAADYGCDVDTTSSCVYVENLETKSVVYTKNADTKTYPASLTKMMTYIVVTENVPDLENTKVTVTERALSGMDPQSSVMGLTGYIGEKFAVVDLLRGLMIPSGNDAALVLADYIGDGNISTFVELMNRKAAQLGCQSTHFVNPHGLFDPMHYSTASDLAVIAKYAATKPYYNEIVGTLKYTVPGMSTPIENTNYMIDPSKTQYYYDKVLGGKTGFTDEAGKCLVTTAQQGDYTYLCVALGAPYTYAEDVNYAMLDTKALYQWAFDNISVVELLPKDEVIRSLSVAYVFGDKKVDVVPQNAVAALLPNDYDETLVSVSVSLPPSTRAPLAKGQILGSINIYYDGEQVGHTYLLSSETIEVDGFSVFLHNVMKFITEYFLLMIILICVLIAFIVVTVYRRRMRKKRESNYRYR